MQIELFLLLGFVLPEVLTHPTRIQAKWKPGIVKRVTANLDDFRPKISSVYTQQSKIDLSSVQSESDPEQAATNLVKSLFPDATFRLVNDKYTGISGLTHLNFKQTVNDHDIQNADFHVNVAPDGTILSYGNSFLKDIQSTSNLLEIPNLITPVPALKTVVETLGLPVQLNDAQEVSLVPQLSFNITGVTGLISDPVANLVYYQTPEGLLTPSWRIETDLGDDWLISYVNGLGTGEILAVANYNAEASYNVYAWPLANPVSGSRTNEVNPDDAFASEFGWLGNGVNTFTITAGNNGIAQANLNGDNDYLNDPRPESANSDFDYPYDAEDAQPSDYTAASVTQLFYTANKYHDLLYNLGFTEAAGNFEMNNDGKGGLGNDAVILNSQDGSGFNNANFATPPDGQAPRMRMYIFTATSPERDCAFDAGVVIHEYTHGLSNRLTGGSANGECLNTLASAGLGEGWSDFYPTAIRTDFFDTRDTVYPIGDWVTGRSGGIRLYPYSTDLEVNPLKFSSINDYHEVHEIGTVWGTMLYEVMWNLIDEYGNTVASSPFFDNGVPTDGRFLSMYLVALGMALQPCNPSVIDARDAILDADNFATRGQNSCLIWKGFAKRGLGVSAFSFGTNSNVDAYDVPDGC